MGNELKGTGDWERWPWWSPTGFRLSLLDLLVAMVVGILTWLVWSSTDGLIVLLPVVLGHFFLFCNVFRIHRRLDMWWSVVFVMIAGIWLWWQPAPWWWLPLGAAPIALTVIVCEMLSPRYHGIGARDRSLQPGIDQDPEGRTR